MVTRVDQVKKASKHFGEKGSRSKLQRRVKLFLPTFQVFIFFAVILHAQRHTAGHLTLKRVTGTRSIPGIVNPHTPNNAACIPNHGRRRKDMPTCSTCPPSAASSPRTDHRTICRRYHRRSKTPLTCTAGRSWGKDLTPPLPPPHYHRHHPVCCTCTQGQAFRASCEPLAWERERQSPRAACPPALRCREVWTSRARSLSRSTSVES